MIVWLRGSLSPATLQSQLNDPLFQSRVISYLDNIISASQPRSKRSPVPTETDYDEGFRQSMYDNSSPSAEEWITTTEVDEPNWLDDRMVLIAHTDQSHPDIG
jgi:hypothetical protein